MTSLAVWNVMCRKAAQSLKGYKVEIDGQKMGKLNEEVVPRRLHK